MKKVSLFLAIIIALSMLAACAKAPEVEEEAKPENLSGYEEAKDEWLRVNQLGPYDTGEQDWDAIKAAAFEEGELLVYANSSKTEKAALKFMEIYPEIKVQAFDLGGDDVILKTQEEQRSGAFVGDVWFSSGGETLKGELIPAGYVWKFVPDDVADVIPEKYQDPLLVSRLGSQTWGYNSELNDSCPISNIWELTEPEWENKIFIENPIDDASTLSKLITFASHPEEMAEAYKAFYGEDPVLDEDTKDAGWLWLKRFAQNNPIPQPGGDEVDSAFATPGMTENFLAFTSYGNYPDVLEGNLAFELCWELEPVGGVSKQSYIGILNQATHPNAAKLWIKFITTLDGIDPWYKIGTYLPNPQMPPPEGALPFDYIEENTWAIDDGFVWDNLVAARDFYLINLGNK
jgi:iron(III) transport system substrate-binding protein